MGKLGKNARKFAKKNLQSVMKRRRKIKSMINKRFRDKKGPAEHREDPATEPSNGRNTKEESLEDISLDVVFSEDNADLAGEISESDGFLSEDSTCPYASESENEGDLEENCSPSSMQKNSEIRLELAKQKKKLEKLKKKEGFLEFLENSSKDDELFINEDALDDEVRDHETPMDEDRSNPKKSKLLTGSAINSWCKLVTEQHNASALPYLLNGYRAACHYGIESTDDGLGNNSCLRIQNKNALSEITMLMLLKADEMFRGLLGLSCSSCKKEAILELKNKEKWKILRPQIKSYLRSTLFLLKQVTDAEILAFSMNRLRASIIFFAAFPSLLGRLIKIAVHLWATGQGILSSSSFLVLRDVASVFSDSFDSCLIKTYKAFVAHCKFVDSGNLTHVQFLRNSIVELCSLDVQKSINVELVSVNQLTKILQRGLRTKDKEALKKICSWQFANCIDLWVTFISSNSSDYDLKSLMFTIIQVVNGVAHLFPGPRYIPLRIKCIQWLNLLSSCSGTFIPVVSLVLDILEYTSGKEGGKSTPFNISSAVKLPKHWLKSRNFQEECVLSAIELLSVHFAQWSYFISFPELATIPLIYLKKFHDKTTVESLRRTVKRLIDQVEQNIEFVRSRRENVDFSPNNQKSAESFLQLERSGGDAPFNQYYKSVMQKAASQNLAINENISSSELKKPKRRQGRPNSIVDGGVNEKRAPEKDMKNPSIISERERKTRKKQKT